MRRTFRNPANGHTESISNEAPGLVVLFGPIYLAIRGLWGHFFIWIILVGGFTLLTGGPGLIIALPIAIIAYGCTIKSIIAKSYLRRGWREIADSPTSAPEQSIVSPDGLRECPFCAEMIKAQAVKCRYCSSEVEPIPFKAASPSKPAEVEASKAT